MGKTRKSIDSSIMDRQIDWVILCVGPVDIQTHLAFCVSLCVCYRRDVVPEEIKSYPSSSAPLHTSLPYYNYAPGVCHPCTEIRDNVAIIGVVCQVLELKYSAICVSLLICPCITTLFVAVEIWY